MPKRDADYSEDNKMVVSNSYVRAIHPERMNINAMKLFRLVVTQCRLKDKEFYEYDFRLTDLAASFEISRQNLYRDVQEMCKSMVQMIMYIGDGNPRHRWEFKPIFRTCYYEPRSGMVTVQLNEDMTELFLQLKRDFTQVPISAVLTMKSKYAIRLFEVICEKVGKYLPYANHATQITLSIEEIRKATNTEKKKTYDIITNLRNRILEPAIKDIEENADWKIILTDVKQSRRIVGFDMEIWSRNGYEVIEKYKREGKLPPMPKYTEEDVPGQMNLFDYEKN